MTVRGSIATQREVVDRVAIGAEGQVKEKKFDEQLTARLKEEEEKEGKRQLEQANKKKTSTTQPKEQ